MLHLVRRILARLSRFRKPPTISPGPPEMTREELRRFAQDHHRQHVMRELDRFLRDRLPLN